MSRSQSANILVVDDNEINRDLLKLRLELSGHSVTTVDNGREAIRLLETPRSIYGPGADFDVVLLDIMMPEVSGIDVLVKVRQVRDISELPIIMVTAKDDSEDVVNALSCGANDYITKPVDFPVLHARLGSALKLSRLTRQKDEFLTIASHDLKNPLAVIRGMIKLTNLMVPQGSIMTEEAVQILRKAYNQTETMERIITDFLDFQAMEDGQLVLAKDRVTIASVCESVAEALTDYAAGKQIVISLSIPTDLAAVNADSARLEQLLTNLVGNAVKFSGPCTSVAVTASTMGNFVRVEVRDHGPGIREDELGALFQKYSRSSNRPTGGEKSSGLGLAICRTIVEMHDGEIGAISNGDQPGSTFWFTLPVFQ